MGISHRLAEHRKRFENGTGTALVSPVEFKAVAPCVPAGDIRNDLYLTLEKGDFERGGKSVQKNIEVTMYVLYADGEILKVSAPFPESLRCSLQGTHPLVPESLMQGKS